MDGGRGASGTPPSGPSLVPATTDETWLRALRPRGAPHPDTLVPPPLPPQPPPIPQQHRGPQPPPIPRQDRGPQPPPIPRQQPEVDEPVVSTTRMFGAVPPRPTDDGSNMRGFRATLATMVRERRRIVWSVIVVALGVGYLAGSLSLLGRVGSGLSAMAGTGTERADLVIEGSIAVDSPLEQVRRLVPDSLRVFIEQVDGVAAVDPRIDDIAVIVDRTGRPLVPLGVTERPAGANWPEVDALNPYRFVGEGAPPTGPGEVVIDLHTAQTGGLEVGDTVLIATKTIPEVFTITGIVTLGENELPEGSSLALFDTDVARTLFDRGTDDNSIGIQLTEDADVDAVTAAIRTMLPPGAEVVDGPTFERHRETVLAKSFNLITYLLIGFAALAIVVSTFTVANSNALLFARRRQGFALLRLVGASSRQLRVAAAVEAALVGLAAVVVGVPLGLLFGAGIERALGALGTAIPVAGPSITPSLVLAVLVVGLGVTVLTAVLPARDAARVSPIVALTRSDDESDGGLPRWVSPLIGLVVGGVAGGLLGWTIAGGNGPILLGAGIGGGVGLIAVLLPRLLSLVVGACARLFVGRSPSLRSLTALRSRRARSRAAATAAALAVATLVVAGLSTLSSSFVASVDAQVSDTLLADLVVDSGTFSRGGLPEALVDELKTVPGVTAVSGVRVGNAAWIGTTPNVRISAMAGDSMFDLVDLAVRNAPERLTPDEIVISRALAEQLDVQVGDQVPITFTAATSYLTVAGIFDRPFALLGEAIIETSVLDASTPSSVDLVAMVRLNPKLRESATAQIERVAARYGVDSVLPPSELISKRTGILRGFEQVIRWMLLFSVALAVIGVANTLQLSVNERRRELGLIRAVGGSASQVIRLVVVEALALSVVGVVAGTLLGVALAYGTVRSLASLGLDQFQLPWGVVGGTALAAAVFGVVGAWMPARRAARSGILDALGEVDRPERDRVPERPGEFRPDGASPTLVPGTAPSDGRQHHAPGPPRSGGAASSTEDSMAARCYQCGNYPGDDERCQFCGASLIPEPLGMFSTAPVVDVAHQPPPPPRVAQNAVPATDLWSTGADGPDAPTPAGGNGHAAATAPGAGVPPPVPRDIVDAAIVEDDEDDVDDHRPPPPSGFEHLGRDGAEASPGQPTSATEEHGDAQTPFDEPSPHFEPRHEAPDAAGSQTLGSIFDEVPASAASPFAQTANEESGAPAGSFRPDPTISEERTGWTPSWTPAARAQQDASLPEGAPADATAPVPPPVPPPHRPPGAAAAAPSQATPSQATPTTYGHDEAPDTFGGPVAPPPGAAGDATGLSSAIERLAPSSQQAGAVAFTVVGALLQRGETVLAAVQGWSLGMPTVVALTTTRAIVVSERRWTPLIEQFPVRSGLAIFGRHVDGAASLSLQEGERLVTIDQIADVGLAVELANVARSRSTGTGF